MSETTFKVEIKKDAEQIGLKLKAPEELESFFRELSHEDSISSVWSKANGNGAEFYRVNEKYNKIERELVRDTFNDYGNGLFKDGKVNLAPLRTKGISEGVEIYSDRFESIGMVDFEKYAQALGEATKRIIERFVKEEEITAKITFKL